MSDFRLVKLIDPPVSINANINPKGAYSNSTTYSVGDVVTYNGLSYIARTTTVGNLPTDTTYWQLIYDDTTRLTTVRNSTGATIYKGTVVYLSGATGSNPNIVKAKADSDVTSARTFGVAYTDIANNADGPVLSAGMIDTLDTRSAATNPFTSVTLAAGDVVYLDPNTAGYITNVKPAAPNHLVYVGFVANASPTNGKIIYRIQNGYELDEIHDVDLKTSAPVDNDLLSYDSATSLWKNKSFTDLDLLTNTDAYLTYGRRDSSNIWSSSNAFTAGEISIDDSNYPGGGFPLFYISNSTTGVLTQQWLSGATPVGQVAQDGLATWFAGSTLRNSAATTKNPLLVINSAAGVIPTIIRGAASQSTDLLQIQNSASTVLTKIDSSGNLTTNQIFGKYTTATAGTTAHNFTTSRYINVTPNASATYTATVPAAGSEATLLILTSGTTSYTITFGTGFKSTGTLATGTVTAKYFIVRFVSDGTNLIEISRTVAI